MSAPAEEELHSSWNLWTVLRTTHPTQGPLAGALYQQDSGELACRVSQTHNEGPPEYLNRPCHLVGVAHRRDFPISQSSAKEKTRGDTLERIVRVLLL